MRLFLPLLPIAVFILLWIVLFQFDRDWRRSTLSAAIAWGVLLTLLTELLSAAHALTLSGVLIAWAISLLFWLVLCRQVTLQPWASPLHHFGASTLLIRLSGIGLVLLPLTLATIAVVVPPNNWDSLTYHMPRVVNWMQNHNINAYPTNQLSQLDQPP